MTERRENRQPIEDHPSEKRCRVYPFPLGDNVRQFDKHLCLSMKRVYVILSLHATSLPLRRIAILSPTPTGHHRGCLTSFCHRHQGREKYCHHTKRGKLIEERMPWHRFREVYKERQLCNSYLFTGQPLPADPRGCDLREQPTRKRNQEFHSKVLIYTPLSYILSLSSIFANLTYHTLSISLSEISFNSSTDLIGLHHEPQPKIIF